MRINFILAKNLATYRSKTALEAQGRLPSRAESRQSIFLRQVSMQIRFNFRSAATMAALVTSLGAVGCGDDETPETQNLTAPTTYAFASRFGPESSVDYGGQVFRHVLILDLKDRIEGFTGRLDGNWIPTPGEVTDELDFYYRFDLTTAPTVAHSVTTTPVPAQTTYTALSDTNKDLHGKLAGNDGARQHKTWATDLVGWPGVTSPTALVQSWFQQLDAAAVAWAQSPPAGISKVYVTTEGLDFKQLLQKFLLGAVAFSQGADDYLDQGLEADNTIAVPGKPYTALEHAWDEGFGYFGAARDYLEYSDDEVAAKGGRPGYASGYHDSDNDGTINLHAEYNFGHSVNAAKRDRGSSPSAPTDFSRDAMQAFLEGRQIITEADGALDNAAKARLEAARDRAVLAWEKAISATIVHYINDVLQDMNRFGTAAYVFEDHAKHWSEMKGFALSLQFNPFSPVTDAQFTELHNTLGQAPVLQSAGAATIDSYKDALRSARSSLQQAYNFEDANMGDANGEGGW